MSPAKTLSQVLIITPRQREITRVLTTNFGKMTFLRHMGKSVRLKTYSTHHKVLKTQLEVWGIFAFAFVSKRSL